MEPPWVGTDGSRFENNRWIVGFNRQDELPSQAVGELAHQLGRQLGFQPLLVFEHVHRGFLVELPEHPARSLERNPNIRSVRRDRVVHTLSGTTQQEADWSLDRIDQRDLPLSGSYSYDYDGAGTRIYVVDSGVRLTHERFGGRAQRVYDRFDSDSDYRETCDTDYVCCVDDCGSVCPIPSPGQGDGAATPNFHGTGVAGKAASGVLGAAQGASIADVRVLNCRGAGMVSDVIDGLAAIASLESAAGGKLAVVNLSIGFPHTEADVTDLEEAIRDLPSNLLLVAAAGNKNTDAATLVPARMAEVITVGASTEKDRRYWVSSEVGSNYGDAVDLFAPGHNVEMPSSENDTATRVDWGSSYSAPLVAGVAAIHAQAEGGFISPGALRQVLISEATTGRLTHLSGSPNRLLYQSHNTGDSGDDGSGSGGGGSGCPYQDEDGNWIMCP
ncbi:S8 family peptidase [Natronospira bacteriovora]|uniref:S8 family peptidase n=1 Tax=Natronospira bacteriovora TaxID=3069753 RepID=A0ABU0W6U8_9GAMM|nr:S8 family peptidase [Natronospira sp. AB-CW4]MDQ2069190.1 S8 family peptidase [Natronospira sp. AB-CW4]